MRNRQLVLGQLALLVCVMVVVVNAEGAGQTPPPPPNRPPTLTLSSGCGPSVMMGQACAITVATSDQDSNLARVELNWNDGTPVESRMVSGGEATTTFSRSFTKPQTVRWSSTAFDSAGNASPQVSGLVNVVAPPAPLGPQVDPSITATSEQQLAPLVVMIRGKFPTVSTVGAGIIFGVASDRLYIATANHVVRGHRVLGGEAPIAQDLQVQFRWLRGEWQPARIVDDSFDESLDLAIITVSGAGQLAVPKLPWASFVKPDMLITGEQVAPIGYPSGMTWFMPQQAHVVSTWTPQVIRTEGDLSPGYSGGALVTKDWGIAGILLNTGSVLNDVLRIDVAFQKIRDWGHEVQAAFKERPKATGASADPATTLARDRQDAEGLVGRWIAATMSRDVQTLLSLVEMPFYFDQEILVRREDLEARLQQQVARAADNSSAWKIETIKATTVGELRAKGEEANRDRVLRNLSMTDDDWQVVVIMAMVNSSRTEGTVFFVRRIGGVMKMVGLWG